MARGRRSISTSGSDSSERHRRSRDQSARRPDTNRRTVHSARGWTLSGVAVSGTYSEALIINAMQHAAMMGLHFRPSGASAAPGVLSVEFADAHVDLASLWRGATVRKPSVRGTNAPAVILLSGTGSDRADAITSATTCGRPVRARVLHRDRHRCLCARSSAPGRPQL